jgi:hypothetical protein
VIGRIAAGRGCIGVAEEEDEFHGTT